MLASWRRIPEIYRPMHSPIVGGAKINRYFYFIHILYILGYVTFIIIHKNSRWSFSFANLFFQVSRTGSFSKECRCSDARNKFIIFPVCRRVHQNILNTSTSQRKTHLRTPFFSRTASGGCFRQKLFREKKVIKILEKYLWRSSFIVTLHTTSLQLY